MTDYFVSLDESDEKALELIQRHTTYRAKAVIVEELVKTGLQAMYKALVERGLK